MAITYDTRSKNDTRWIFEEDRAWLFNQFQNITYDADSGLPPRAIEKMVADFLTSHPGMSRTLQKAHAFRIVLNNCRLHHDSRSLFAGTIEAGSILSHQRQRWYEEIESGPLATEAAWFADVYRAGALRGRLDFHHVAPGWENIFDEGLSGIVARARYKLSAEADGLTGSQRDFLTSVIITNQAAIDLTRRISAYVMKKSQTDISYGPRMANVASVVERCLQHRPGGFYEVLQAMWLYQILVELEGESTMSFGHFDRMLLPYYRQDMETGVMTSIEAKELLKYFWFKFHARRRGEGDSARNFTFAGQDRFGKAVANELTYLSLDAIEELDTPEPKASIRFCAGTPDRLKLRVAKMIQQGHTSMVIMNDEPSIRGLVRHGKTVEDARSYLSIGCYEPAVDGKDMACTMNIPVNLAKGIELTLNNGTDPMTGLEIGAPTGPVDTLKTFADVYEAYKAQMNHLLDTAHRYLSRYEKYWTQINPSPFIAASLDDCIATARDIGDGGCVYNSVGCPAGALAEAADSLLAIKTAVFDDKRYTLNELSRAVATNFEGAEHMRLYLRNRIAKWGTGDMRADQMAVEIADFYCDTVSTLETTRGGPYQPGLFALHFQWTFGQKTGALPCGRMSKTPTAPGTSSGAGLDTKGITALMDSLAKIDFSKAPDGSVLDIMLHPSTLSGSEGIRNIAALFDTHFERGGNYLQFNTIDTETLSNAQKDPERYASLQVRITGYSAYFTKISKYEQDLFIERIKHAV